jgi:thiosulfate/3-mercaptopyruvate sulfurtransferase
MAGRPETSIVETSWLASHLDDPDVVVVDGSMHLPTANRDARTEYLAQHIPGAQFFDINDIADETSHLPHMLPSPAKFASKVSAMGIGDGVAWSLTTARLYSGPRVVDISHHGHNSVGCSIRWPSQMEGPSTA